MAITAILLPVLILLLVWLIQLGIIFVQTSKLKITGDLATQAGATVVIDLIMQKAQNHNAPPDVDPLPFLTDQDRFEILNDPQVKNVAQDYIMRNWADPSAQLQTQVKYPANTVNCNGNQDQKRVQIEVSLSQNLPNLFPSFSGAQTAHASNIKTVRLCP